MNILEKIKQFFKRQNVYNVQVVKLDSHPYGIITIKDASLDELKQFQKSWNDIVKQDHGYLVTRKEVKFNPIEKGGKK